MLAGVRLVVDLLFHEVAVVALLDQGGGGGDDARSAARPRAPSASKIRAPLVVDGDVVALLEIGDPVGEGPDRQGVGAEEHLAVAIADHQRAARGARP